MKPTVVRTDANMQMLQSVWGELTAAADVVTTEDDDEATLLRHAGGADLLIVCYARVTRRVLQAARRLKGVLEWGVGVDNIDIAAATERGIPVLHCPHYGCEAVADHAFALMLALARKLVTLDRAMRGQGWIWPAPRYYGLDMAGKTAGLIGFGRIGQAVARRCLGFGMNVVAYDPFVARKAPEFDRVALVGLAELLTRADFVSIHCVLTPDTTGLLGARELAMLKPSAFLINVSRGAIVDEDALVQALAARRLAGAGLDVFAQEPLGPDHPLLQLENTIVTPHFAYYTEEADARLDREALEAALSVLHGRPLPSVVNPEVL